MAKFRKRWSPSCQNKLVLQTSPQRLRSLVQSTMEDAHGIYNGYICRQDLSDLDSLLLLCSLGPLRLRAPDSSRMEQAPYVFCQHGGHGGMSLISDIVYMLVQFPMRPNAGRASGGRLQIPRTETGLREPTAPSTPSRMADESCRVSGF